MSARLKIEIGDAFRMPLPNGKSAYCQYIFKHSGFGDLVRVFDHITDAPLGSITEIEMANLLLPPVFVGLVAAVKGGRWTRIGNAPVSGFAFPKFRDTMGTKPGTYHDWSIWDGKKHSMVGDLPKGMRALELKSIWGCEALADRIVAGTYRGDRMF